MKPKAYSYIRFSSAEQAKGDSLRRQTEGIEEIAKDLKLDLDDTLYLTDKATSGWKGDNRTKGALGEFLKLVEKDQIAVGSCLIIEKFDRLTREGMLIAVNLMTGILLKGIDIYTKIDGKRFTKDKFDITDLIISAIKLEQGNLFAENLSYVLRKAWINKRAEAINGTRKLTRDCPMWLEPIGYWESEKKFITTDYKPINKCVDTIQLIFEKKLHGKGPDLIAKELNQMEGIWLPVRKKRDKSIKISGWYTSLVNLYLHDRKLIGELQLFCCLKDENNIRVNKPEGDRIIDYYPSVIDKRLFNRVQKLISDNYKKDGRGGGRGDLVNNLFTHMAYCSICGSPMRYLNRGGEPHTRQFRCANALVGLCDMTKLHYLDVENTVLIYCNGLEVADILPNLENAASELSVLQNQLQAKEGEILEQEEVIKRIKINLLYSKTAKYHEWVEDSFLTQSSIMERLNNEKGDIKDQIILKSKNSHQTEEQIKSIKELIDKMKEMTGEERHNLRLSLRTQLKLLISTIKINAKNRELIIYFKTAEAKILKLNADGTATKVLFRTIPRKSKKM